MKVQLHIEGTAYQDKPKDTGRINNAITEVVSEVTPQQLAEKMAQGHTAVLSTMKGKRSNLNMVQQQVLMLDFDNTEEVVVGGKKKKVKTEGMFYSTIEEILADEYVQANASFIYKTFSHQDDWHKFRVAFVLDTPLTNNAQVNAAYDLLFLHFPNADTVCRDSARLFYGGTEVIEVDYNSAMVVSDEVLEIEAQEATASSKIAKKSASLMKKVSAPKVESSEPKTWQLIKAGEKEQVKERLSGYAVSVPSKTSARNVLKTFNMMEFMGETFNPCFDFFHFEKSPSASIFKKDGSDIWLYKCHSGSQDNKPMDLIILTSKLLNVSYMQALNYLIEVTGIQIVETEQVKEIREQADLFMGMLLSEDLQDIYPEVHGRFWRYKRDIVSLLTIFKENIYEDEQGNIRSLSWYSTESLAVMVHGTASKKKTIERVLNLMAYTNWIEKLDDSQIPSELLKKLKATQDSNKRTMRSNVFELLLLTDGFFDTLNDQCLEMKQNGFTMKGFSQEYVARTNGKNAADDVFVQHKEKKISIKAEKMVRDIHTITLELIADRGYATEVDVLKKLKRKWKSKAYNEVKLKQCISEMLDLYDLKRVSLTKAMKAHFGLDTSTKGSPKVIVKSDLNVVAG